MSSLDDKQSFEKLYGTSLTSQQVAEMKFNLVSYVKTLIQMDKQHKDWLEKKKQDTPDSNKSGSNEPTEVIN